MLKALFVIIRLFSQKNLRFRFCESGHQILFIANSEKVHNRNIEAFYVDDGVDVCQ